MIGEHNKGKKMAKHIPEQVELTNMCMIVDEKNNKVLVQKRTKHNWDGMAFPGGHIEKGESVIRSTTREVKEETNLDISDLQCIGFKDWFIDEADKRYFVFLFKTSTFSGNLLLSALKVKICGFQLMSLKNQILQAHLMKLLMFICQILCKNCFMKKMLMAIL